MLIMGGCGILWIGILVYKLMGYQGVFAQTYCHGTFHESDYILQVKIVIVSIHSHLNKSLKVLFHVVYESIGSKFGAGALSRSVLFQATPRAYSDRPRYTRVF